MNSVARGELLIGGQFVSAAASETKVRAPFDGRILGTTAVGGWTEMDAALDAAQRAFTTWRRSPRSERQALLRRIVEALRDRTDELVETLTDEVGKPVTWSRGEVARTVLTFGLAADLLDGPETASLPLDFDPRGAGTTCEVRRYPVGTVLAVTPYNWPYNLAAHKVAPALAAGNTVVLKPSPLAPLSSLLLARVIHEAGCPAGVVNAVDCDGPTTQRAAQDDRVRIVSFTGSDKVGWMLKGLLPDKRVVLELGGDASVVVMPDADLGWAVERTVLGAFGYAGQICISVQHVLVHADVYDDVRERLVTATRACPSGDPRRPETVSGPMIDSAAADKVVEWVEEAVALGGRVLAGGTRDGNVVRPTLVEDVPSGARLATGEVFGPVLTLGRFETAEEAIERVNASRYGIHTGVFTRDQSLADRFYDELEVGGVIVNDYPTLRFDNMPYGGVKRSGFGREGVKYAYEEMTELKVRLTRSI